MMNGLLQAWSLAIFLIEMRITAAIALELDLLLEAHQN
jgi:hypothetical protein